MHNFADCGADRIDGSSGSVSERMFEVGKDKDLFDVVQAPSPRGCGVGAGLRHVIVARNAGDAFDWHACRDRWFDDLIDEQDQIFRPPNSMPTRR